MATEEDQFYWHTVYKISDLLSPREDNKSFNDDSKTEDTPNKRLTLLTGNMGAEEEISLRSLLMLKKDLWFIKGEAESIVSLLDADEALQDTQSQLYCRAIFSKFSGELDYLICFLSASKSGLELFQTDLDKFSSKLIPHLEKYTESNDTNEYWKEFEDWPKSVLSFVKECLATFDYDLATLLCAVS
ncbi:uncharacterized protein [Clytia hemisphaerica]|uniref:Uncharacterized protein n=1 Tax=Clytia hemisphaerica TaxID=252671 RepID=A0A7M5X2E0_9CNID